MSIPAKFMSNAEARRAGFFSRRHQTNAGLQEARSARDVEQEVKQDLVDAQTARASERKAKGLPKLPQDQHDPNE